MSEFRYPTFDEMRALEHAARRARYQELARLLRAAIGLWTRTVSTAARRPVRHA
jgi:hypothetical protein